MSCPQTAVMTTLVMIRRSHLSCLSAAGTVDLHRQCKRFKSGLRDKPLRVSLSVSLGRFQRALTEGGGLTLSVVCTILWARILDGVEGQRTQAQAPTLVCLCFLRPRQYGRLPHTSHTMPYHHDEPDLFFYTYLYTLSRL